MKFTKKLTYASADLGFGFLNALISTFLTVYLTDSVGLGAALVGNIMVFSRVLDGVTDLFMGTLIDRTNTKYGKARPWVLFTIVPFAILTIMMFNVPGSLSITGKSIYLGIIYIILMTVFYTANNIAYGTMLALITTDPKDRVIIGSMRYIMAVIANILISSLTLGLVANFGGGQKGWSWVVVLYAAIFITLMMFSMIRTKEVVKDNPAEKGGESKVSFPIAIKIMVTSKYFWLMLFVFITVYVTNA